LRQELRAELYRVLKAVFFHDYYRCNRSHNCAGVCATSLRSIIDWMYTGLARAADAAHLMPAARALGVYRLLDMYIARQYGRNGADETAEAAATDYDTLVGGSIFFSKLELSLCRFTMSLTHKFFLMPFVGITTTAVCAIHMCTYRCGSCSSVHLQCVCCRARQCAKHIVPC
jgi:hypothetical protein